VDHEDGFKVLYDVPTKEASVGVVHKPEVVVIEDWKAGVRQLLAGTAHDSFEVIARLEARWR
jgi:hypothetical protein